MIGISANLAARKEHQLLLACLRTDSEPDLIARLLRMPFEWGSILELASAQGVRSSLYLAIEATATAAVPRNVLHQLRRHYFDQKRWHLGIIKKLGLLIELLHSVDVRLVPYKGPVLAEMLYVGSSIREFNDIDLFIDKSDLDKAKDVLIANYFNIFIPTSYQDEEELREFGYNLTFFDREALKVELHWAFTSSLLPLSFNTSDLWDRLDERSFDGRLVPFFAAEDLVILLCAHGCKHAWDGSLRTVSDLAALTRCGCELNWQVVEDRARDSGAWRMLALGLLLAHGLLEADVPKPLLRRAADDEAQGVLVARALEGLFRSSPCPANPFPFYVMLAR